MASISFRRYRELGNQAFTKGMDWKALELYNESVCQAPQEQNDKEKVCGEKSDKMNASGPKSGVSSLIKTPLKFQVCIRRLPCMKSAESLNH